MPLDFNLGRFIYAGMIIRDISKCQVLLDIFYSLKVHYYNLMGWKYWQCQEVLNRAPLPDNEIWNTQKWQDALALKAKRH